MTPVHDSNNPSLPPFGLEICRNQGPSAPYNGWYNHEHSIFLADQWVWFVVCMGVCKPSIGVTPIDLAIPLALMKCTLCMPGLMTLCSPVVFYSVVLFFAPWCWMSPPLILAWAEYTNAGMDWNGMDYWNGL